MRAWIELRFGQSSRNGPTPVALPSGIGGLGASGPQRQSRSEQLSVSTGYGPLSGGLARGRSYSRIDFLDLNGDRFPDVLAKGKGAQLSTPGGVLESKVCNLDMGDVRETATTSGNLGMSAADPPMAKGNSKGNVDTRAGFGAGQASSGPSKPSFGFSVGQSIAMGGSNTAADLIDMNGDGLPDRVLPLGDLGFAVELNLGYGFSAPRFWENPGVMAGDSEINQGKSISFGLQAGGFSTLGKGFAGGISYSRRESTTSRSLADINGDGLPDLLRPHGTSELWVAFNTGVGFTDEVLWTGALATASEESNNAAKFVQPGQGANIDYGLGVHFTITIGPVCPGPCYIVINPGANVAQSLNRQEMVMMDVNGDGLPDHLFSKHDGELMVAENRTGRTNLLTKVERPLGGSIHLTYQRRGNTTDNPHSRWVLGGVVLEDGVVDSAPWGGADVLVSAFEYGDGKYDRFEREFLGFNLVREIQLDTTGESAGPTASSARSIEQYINQYNTPITHYRDIVRIFANNHVYDKGLLLSESVGVPHSPPLRQTVHEYALHNIHLNRSLDTQDFMEMSTATVFPQLRKTITSQREVLSGDMLQTRAQSFAYDAFGNVIQFIDHGDAADSADDLVATMTYTGPGSQRNSNCGKEDVYIVGKVDSLKVEGCKHRGSPGTCTRGTLRRRFGRYDCQTGALLRLVEHLGSERLITFLNYDGRGNLEQVVRPPNHAGQKYTLNFKYDDVVQTYVTNIQDSFGLSSQASYNFDFGEVTSTTDANGQSIVTLYDDFGRPEYIIGPYEQAAGHPYTLAFDYFTDQVPARARTRHLDPARNLEDPIDTLLYIDGLGRVIQTKKDASVRGIDSMVVSGRVVFDHVGRSAITFHPTAEPKNDNHLVSLDPSEHSTKTTFDVLDRVVLTTFADGSELSTAFAITPEGMQRALITDDLGNQKAVVRNARELIVAVQERLLGNWLTAQYSYNTVDELLLVIDAHGNRTQVAYDELGRRVSIANPDAGTTVMRYDGAGNLIERIPENLATRGQSIKLSYDHNRLVAINYPLNPQNNVRYIYGAAGAPHFAAGRIVTVEDASGNEQRQYGRLGELVRQERFVDTIVPGNQGRYVTSYAYDTWGRLQRMSYPDGEVLVYSYDSGGQPRRAVGKLGEFERVYVDELLYDEFGERVLLRLGNGTVSTYSYEPAMRRLDSLDTGPAGGKLFQKLSYGYDSVGNITSLSNNASIPEKGFGGTMHQRFEYDDLCRLVEADGRFNGSKRRETYTLSMDYDGIHNILSKSQTHHRHTPGGQAIAQKTTTYDVSYAYQGRGPHQATQIGDKVYAFDANGNQLGWRHTRNGTRRNIVWDEENRMSAISDNGRTIRFVYDASGMRVLKRGQHGETAYVNQFFQVANGTTQTKHVFVGNSRIASILQPGLLDTLYVSSVHPGQGIIHRNAIAAAKSSNLEKNPHLLDYTREKQANSNFLYFYHPDHLGSSSFVTDKDAKIYEHLEYFPFGETWVSESTNEHRTRYLFTSKELDEETGLYYFGARYYDPTTSVWQSVDPALERFIPLRSDGSDILPAGGIFSPSNLALYGYVKQNPLVLVDDTGLWATPVHDFLMADFFGTRVSRAAVQSMQRGSRQVDALSQQFRSGTSPRHNMLERGMTPTEMHVAQEDFMKGEARIAKSKFDQAKAAMRHGTRLGHEKAQELLDEAYFHVGQFLHPVQDSTSPAHTTGGVPDIWPGGIGEMLEHGPLPTSKERLRNLTPELRSKTHQRMRQALEKHFKGYEEFLPPRPE